MRSPSIHLVVALVAAFVAVSSYGTWFYVISQKSTDVAALQNMIAVESGNINRIAAARAALIEIAGDEAKVRSYFVPESSVVTFINDLEARGQSQKAAVSVLSVSTGGTPAQPTLLLALTIKGTFDSVMRTVGAIEYAPYAITITTLSVQQDVKNSWYANLNMTVGSVSMKAATSTP